MMHDRFKWFGSGGAGALGVITLVPLLVFAGFELLPPPTIVDVPAYGGLERAGEVVGRLPVEAAKFGGIEAVTTVVPGTVEDESQKIVWLTQQIQDGSTELNSVDLVATADVVNLARLTVV